MALRLAVDLYRDQNLREDGGGEPTWQRSTQRWQPHAHCSAEGLGGVGLDTRRHPLIPENIRDATRASLEGTLGA